MAEPRFKRSHAPSGQEKRLKTNKVHVVVEAESDNYLPLIEVQNSVEAQLSNLALGGVGSFQHTADEALAHLESKRGFLPLTQLVNGLSSRHQAA